MEYFHHQLLWKDSVQMLWLTVWRHTMRSVYHLIFLVKKINATTVAPWALIKSIELEIQSGCLFKLGAYWRLGAYKKFSPFSASGKLFCNETMSNNKILRCTTNLWRVTQSLMHFSFFLFFFLFFFFWEGGGELGDRGIGSLAFIRGWAPIKFHYWQGGCLFNVGTYPRLGSYLNKYSKYIKRWSMFYFSFHRISGQKR